MLALPGIFSLPISDGSLPRDRSEIAAQLWASEAKSVRQTTGEFSVVLGTDNPRNKNMAVLSSLSYQCRRFAEFHGGLRKRHALWHKMEPRYQLIGAFWCRDTLEEISSLQ